MTIAEDTTTPAVALTSSAGPQTVTTAAFSPPANSLLLALGSGGWNQTTASAVPTISDSTGGTWTTGSSVAGLVSSESGGSCIVAYRYLSTAPGSMTVSCATDSHNLGGTWLKVVVLTGAASTQNGATATLHTGTISTTWATKSITTTATNSRVYGVVDQSSDNHTLTAGTATSFVTQGGGTNPWSDSVHGTCAAGMKASTDTGTPGSITLTLTSGSSGSAGCLALFEVLPSGGTTTVSGIDSATGTDNAIVLFSSVSDTGAGADTGHAAPNGTETATGADAANVTGSVPDSETGTGADTATVSASLPAADTGTATDSGVAAVNASTSDTGTGVDTATVIISVIISASDAGTGVDTATVAISGAADSGSAVEAFTLTASVPVADTGTGDDESTLFTVFAGRPLIRVAHVNPEDRTLYVKKAGVPRG